MKPASKLPKPAATAKHIIGTGYSSSAIIGEAIEKIRAMKLHKPKEVAANMIGNIEACAIYKMQKLIAIQHLATNIKKKKV